MGQARPVCQVFTVQAQNSQALFCLDDMARLWVKYGVVRHGAEPGGPKACRNQTYKNVTLCPSTQVPELGTSGIVMNIRSFGQRCLSQIELTIANHLHPDLSLRTPTLGKQKSSPLRPAEFTLASFPTTQITP